MKERRTTSEGAYPLPDLTAERLERWAYRRTERDRRMAVAKGKPISQGNLSRLLRRRLYAVKGVSE